MYGVDDLVVSMGDFNEHVDRHIDDGIDYVHGGYDVGQRNLEREM